MSPAKNEENQKIDKNQNRKSKKSVENLPNIYQSNAIDLNFGQGHNIDKVTSFLKIS